jgi:hypothetical protein
LYRRHKPPLQCLRCWSEFGNDVELETHSRAEGQCDLQAKPPTVVMSTRKLGLIRSKRRFTSDPGEEGRWRDIYRILFPGAEIPCACISGYVTQLHALILILVVDYEPPLCGLDIQSSRPSASSELETFQEYARQYLPLAVERAFEIIIQQRFQPLETELRNWLNVKDVVRTSLSELFRTWQARDLLTGSQSLTQQNNRARSDEDVPTIVEGEMGDFAQFLPNPAGSELPGSLTAPDNALAEVQDTIDAPDTLVVEYPCICYNKWPLGLSAFPISDAYVVTEPSQSYSSFQESLATIDSSQTSVDFSQTYAEIASLTDCQGKGKAREQDPGACLPSRTFCCYCAGLL